MDPPIKMRIVAVTRRNSLIVADNLEMRRNVSLFSGTKILIPATKLDSVTVMITFKHFHFCSFLKIAQCRCLVKE